MSGRKPADIDLAMLYDSFTITVLLTLEAVGLCGRGEGKDFVKNQRTAPGGEFPLNTNGGGLSYCHPGMYGIFTMIEARRPPWGIDRKTAGEGRSVLVRVRVAGRPVLKKKNRTKT